jgi:O-antigen ligase
MKIRIRHRTDFEKIILGIFVVIFGEGVLSIFVPQIHLIYYLTDLFNILLFIGLLKKGMREKRINSNLKYFYFVMLLYIILAIAGAIVNYSNIALHLWSFRNYFTTLLFFVECVSFEHSDRIDFLNILVWVNFVASLIEVALGYRQDWVGGIYGVSGGQVNGSLNILLIIIFSRFIVQYINKEISTLSIMVVGVTSLIIATFAELKIFYVEVVIIIVLASLVTKFSLKKIILIILGTAGILVAIKYIFLIFPDIDENMFTISYMWKYLTNSGGYVGQFAHDAGDVNRLAFWDKCVALFRNKEELLFGLGIGNCDQIELIGLKSYIYKQYSPLHYYMFPLPMILLQQGVIGIVLYLMLFVALFLAVLKKYKSNDYISKSQIQMTLILCVMAFIITIYDTSLLGKGGYLFFYIMSLPFINYTAQREGHQYDS